MKISVVVPIYNVEKYLDKCINSICNQSYTNLEIILVDDGSTDGCSEICDKYASFDKRITVIHKNNGGLVSARKTGINVATGEYLLFVDGDDWIEPDHVKLMIKSLYEQNPDIGIALSLKREYRDGSIAEVLPSNDCRLQERIYHKNEFDGNIWPEFINDNDIEVFDIPVNIIIKLYRTDFIRKCIDEVDDKVTMGEDCLTNFICLVNADSIGIIKDSGYHYMIHDKSMVHQNDYRSNVKAIRTTWNCACKYIDLLNLPLYKKNYFEGKWTKFIYYSFMTAASEYFCGLSNDYLFPYPNIKNGSHILVYGMGGYGAGLIRYILSSERFVLAGISDRQIKKSCIKKIDGIDVNEFRPEDVINAYYDYIVVTTSRRNLSDSIEKYLINMGVKPEKIAHMDQKLFNIEPFSSKWGRV